MQTIMRFIVALFLLSSVIASSYHSSTKLRRDGVLNLYPFPRVGRASRNTWQLPLSELFLESEPIEKRQLYAFPRVGRSDLSLLRGESMPDYQSSGVRLTESPGMWFGPRLGRAFKSEEDEVEPATKRQLYAFPRVGRSVTAHESLTSDDHIESPGMWFGPRLGRSFKSDEDEITIQTETADHSEPEQTDPVHNERKKRHTTLN